ncbi:MAG: Uracil glycosylase superfamily protein [Gemmataceae bacterium]|nr:Uracil glycosylase superfamily protein [Gemmataceae bacterium]
MASTPDPRAALARQLKLHLESLKAAGVEFVPVVAPMTFTLPDPVMIAAPVPEAQPEPLAGPPISREAAKQGVPFPPPDPTAVPISVPAVTGLFDEPQTTIPDSPADRRHELTVLAESVAPCARCPELYATRTQTVFGVGPVDPDICFVGEAPGADEDATGEPFVGRAGQLLNRIIAACGYEREEVYICNTIKCRPPNNRTPTPDERSNCREYFDSQIALVRPKYIVCLGATAAQNVLGTPLGIGRLRGRVHKYRNIPVVCTYHPAALLRTEAWKKDTWEDMKMLLRTMGRPIPGGKT